jgi:hypothetical protein
VFSGLPIRLAADMLMAMHGLRILASLALSGSVAFGQAGAANPAFDVASARPCQHSVGPDYYNQFTYTPSGIKGRNGTLKRLIAEAYPLQLNQVSGPG